MGLLAMAVVLVTVGIAWLPLVWVGVGFLVLVALRPLAATEIADAGA
jgi:hypothetical protein